MAAGLLELELIFKKETMKTKYHPILFSTPMVQGIDENRKTQTRRIIKLPNYHPSRTEKHQSLMTIKDWNLYDENNELIGKMKCPYEVGDVLWVRETFTEWPKGEFQYFAKTALGNELGKWKPSLFMPKIACRTFLKIKSIRAERLNEISNEDAIAEGVFEHADGGFMNYLFTAGHVCAQVSFESLWRVINGKDSWNKNPFVWVYEFEKIEKPEDFI